jgi:hypothetical protein
LMSTSLTEHSRVAGEMDDFLSSTSLKIWEWILGFFEYFRKRHL